jgi:hypothetical protein
MLLHLKRWRLLVIALVAAFAVTIATSSEAFANEPGEGNTWTPEYSGGVPVQSQDTFSEAQSPPPEQGGTGALVHVWRGYFERAVGAYLADRHRATTEPVRAPSQNVPTRLDHSGGTPRCCQGLPLVSAT